MAKIAFINMCYTSPWGLARDKIFSDPVHLIPMNNIAMQNGVKSKIFQYGYPTVKDSLEQIRQFSPGLLGLSFIDSQKWALEGAHDLIKALSEPPKIILIGGPDPTGGPALYGKEFARHADTSGNTVFSVVRGRGESLISVLTKGSEADIKGFIKKHGSFAEVDGHAIVVLDGMPSVPLNELDFSRPYDFSAFNFEANVKWELGCYGRCKFCIGSTKKVEYRSEELILEELQMLREQGVGAVRLASPDFTADPDKSSAIISILPTIEHGYAVESRVDSFHKAMTRHPAAWKRFADLSPFNTLELGVESFIPERLVRVGKYSSLSGAVKHEKRLTDILEFFRGTYTDVSVFLIHLDWQMDLAEAMTEAKKTLALLEKYGDVAQIGAETGIGRKMRFQAGSAYSSTMKPIDYSRFKRDPRLFLLYIRTQLEIQKAADDLESGVFGEEEQPSVTMAMLNYYIECIESLEKVDPHSIDIDRAVGLLGKGLTYYEITTRLIEQMGSEGKKLKGVFYLEE